jgi:hydroxymethylbilane synthase
MTMTKPILRIGTRGSPLALAQARETRERLAAAHPDLSGQDACEIVVIETTGDRVRDRALAELGGKGLFTKEIEAALMDGRIDLAVHSMKDVPTWLPDGLEIAAVLPREDPRDAFLSPHGRRIADLPEGAVFGTASLRRQAQVLALRPDLRCVLLRGNVDTRLKKLAAGEVDATMLALAGLRRLGREAEAQAALDPDEILPAVGQGAIGLQVRSNDERARNLVRLVDDPASSRQITAERACLEVLDGSCRTPIAVLAEPVAGTQGLRLRALVAEPDGSALYRSEAAGPGSEMADAEALGRAVGRELRQLAGEAFFAALADRFGADRSGADRFGADEP